MRFKAVKMLVLATSLLGLGACEYLNVLQAKKTTCSDQAGQAVIHDLMKKGIEDELKAYLADDGRKKFDLAKIRASVSQLSYSLQSIRTAKEDPNSSKVFCEAEFAVTFPAKVLDDANTALKESEALDHSVEDALDRYGFKKSSGSANVYQAHILYAFQPTDDGKEIYAEIENSGSLIEGLTDVVNQAMSKTLILESKSAELKAQAEADAEEARLQREEEERIQQEMLAEEARLRDIDLAEQNRQKAVLKQAQEENKILKTNSIAFGAAWMRK